jgi:hypothetical protein
MNKSMEPEGANKKRMGLIFPTMAHLSGLKNHIQCNDFYIDRDAFTIVGTFSETDIDLATKTYGAKITVQVPD